MSVDRTPSERVDVCVVGAGVAGGVVAYSLARRGHDVVVLEAGPRFDPETVLERMQREIRPAYDSLDVWDMGGERDKYTFSVGEKISCYLNRQRVKGVGGTTLHWGGGAARMHEKDFNMASRYDLAMDWPIDYEDLRPYYAAAERELGVAGRDDNPFEPPHERGFPMEGFPLSPTDELFAEACKELGITVHTAPLAINSEGYDGRSQCLGYSTCSPVCPSGAKYSGDVHVRMAEAEGARIIDSVPVQRLRHNEDGDEVVAAEYATPDGSVYEQRARHFVVACGGIETPRLLLLSESETHPNGLANSSGAVGRYFHSQSGETVIGKLDRPANQEPIGFTTALSQQFYDHDAPRPGSIELRFNNIDPVSPAEIALRGGDTTRLDDLKDPLAGDLWGDELYEKMQELSIRGNRRIRITAIVETLPRRENAVTLNRDETDDHGNPVPHVTYEVGNHAVETSERAIEIMKGIFDELGAEITEVSDPEEQRVGNHHLGTTRMGEDPDRSVVGSRLRTHDVDNLWISSSSVFTTGGAVPPTLTIAALSLKAADHIDEEL